MRAPAFWWRERPSGTAMLLAPAGAFYGAVNAARMARPGVRLPVPVVCVGNLVAGGAGKTPVALALGRMLAAAGRRPAYLSRGYGSAGIEAGTVLAVDPSRHTARDCGDEPLLLAGVAPTFVSADRVAAGRRAIAAGADVLVMDDGLQNPALVKDVALAVVDAGVGIGNGFCVPAGPLRAPVTRQWPHVSAVCLVGTGKPGEAVEAEASASGVPVLRARLDPDPDMLARLRGHRVLAFAGIGRPAKFFETLRRAGVALVGTRAFADHHAYAAADLDSLRREADAGDALLVTTSKDRVRLPAAFETATLEVVLRFEDTAAVQRLLDELTARR